MTNEFTPEELESIELLQALKDVPERSPKDAAVGRAAFLSSTKELVSTGNNLRLKWWESWSQPPILRTGTLTIAILAIFFTFQI